MLKIERTTNVSRCRVAELISSVDVFFIDALAELERLDRTDGTVNDYQFGITMCEQALQAYALQPKVHGLFCLYTYVNIERRTHEMGEEEKKTLDALSYAIPEQIIKMMTE